MNDSRNSSAAAEDTIPKSDDYFLPPTSLGYQEPSCNMIQDAQSKCPIKKPTVWNRDEKEEHSSYPSRSLRVAQKTDQPLLTELPSAGGAAVSTSQPPCSGTTTTSTSSSSGIELEWTAEETRNPIGWQQLLEERHNNTRNRTSSNYSLPIKQKAAKSGLATSNSTTAAGSLLNNDYGTIGGSMTRWGATPPNRQSQRWPTTNQDMSHVPVIRSPLLKYHASKETEEDNKEPCSLVDHGSSNKLDGNKERTHMLRAAKAMVPLKSKVMRGYISPKEGHHLVPYCEQQYRGSAGPKLLRQQRGKKGHDSFKNRCNLLQEDSMGDCSKIAVDIKDLLPRPFHPAIGRPTTIYLPPSRLGSSSHIVPAVSNNDCNDDSWGKPSIPNSHVMPFVYPTRVADTEGNNTTAILDTEQSRPHSGNPAKSAQLAPLSLSDQGGLSGVITSPLYNLSSKTIGSSNSKANENYQADPALLAVPGVLPSVKPLNAYNYFYSEMRHGLLHLSTSDHRNLFPTNKKHHGEALQQGDDWRDCAAVQQPGLLASTIIRNQNAIFSKVERKKWLLSKHWNKDRNARRTHRTQHGKFSFNQMNELVSAEWKHLSVENKAFYKDVANADRRRYQEQKQEFACSSCTE